MSPELLDPGQFNSQRSRPTWESDCYALGMVTLEVLSGQAPFAHYPDLAVMWKVLKGEHPRRPRGVKGAWFTDGLWGMLELCWATQPKSRPSVEAMFECFVQMSAVWRQHPPLLDGDGVEMDETDEDVETDGSLTDG